MASTTSTQDSGLFGYLLPLFKAKTGIDVKVIAQGTGQALDTARRGDADVVFVHAKAQEEKFVAEGFGVKRFDVMYNDFVLIGPKSDPAGVKGKDIDDRAEGDPGQGRAIRVARRQLGHPFGRTQRSGSRPASTSPPARVPGIARSGRAWARRSTPPSAMNAYVLSDRGTWISFKNRGDLEIVVEGDKRLFNQYGVMLVNPAKYPTVKKELGQTFIDWLISPEGQAAIAGYKIGGQQLFFPNAEQEGRRERSAERGRACLPIGEAIGSIMIRPSACRLRSHRSTSPSPALLRWLEPVAPVALPLAEALGCIAADMPPLTAHSARDIAVARWLGVARQRSRRRLVLFAAAAVQSPVWVEAGDAMPAGATASSMPMQWMRSGPMMQVLAEAIPGQGVRRAGGDIAQAGVCDRRGRRVRPARSAARARGGPVESSACAARGCASSIFRRRQAMRRPRG